MLLIISGITPAFLTMLPNQVSVVEAATNVKINKSYIEKGTNSAVKNYWYWGKSGMEFFW